MLRGELSTPVSIQGELYRSGGGGSTVEINPVYSTGTKIADYEINGVEGGIYIPKINITTLWDYLTDGNGNIYWSGGAITLRDDINNYDEIVLEIVSNIGDLSDAWRASNQYRLITSILVNAIEPYAFTICSYDTRSAKYKFTSTALQKLQGSGVDNGVIKIYGINY